MRFLFFAILAYLWCALASDLSHGDDFEEILGGQDATLKPAVHHSTDLSDHKHLHPDHNATLFYGEDDSDDENWETERDSMVAAFATFRFHYPAVALEHSRYIASVVCGRDQKNIYVRFGYKEAYAQAKRKWSPHGGFLLIGHGFQGCISAHSQGDRFWALTSEVHFDDAHKVAACKIKQLPLADVADTMDMEYGKHIYSEPEKLYRRYIRQRRSLPKREVEQTRTLALTVPVYATHLAERAVQTTHTYCRHNPLIPLLRSHETSSATPFCNSFLHQTTTTLPTQTQTSTVVNTYTQVFTTTTLLPGSTSHVTVSTKTTSTFTTTKIVTKHLHARANTKSTTKQTLPSYLRHYRIRQVSNACSCIVTQTTGTFSTATFTPYQTIPVTVSSYATRTSTVVKAGSAVVETSTLVGYVVKTTDVVETITLLRTSTSASNTSKATSSTSSANGSGTSSGTAGTTATTTGAASSSSGSGITAATTSAAASSGSGTGGSSSTSGSNTGSNTSPSSSSSNSNSASSNSATNTVTSGQQQSSPASSLTDSAASGSSTASSTSDSSDSPISSTSTYSPTSDPFATDPVYPNPSIPFSQDPTSLLNFDQALDAALGTLDPNAEDFISLIMPGVDPSSLDLSTRGLGKRGLLSKLKKAASSAAHAAVHAVASAVKQGGAAVGHAIEKYGAKAVKSVVKAGKTLAKVAKKVGAAFVKAGKAVVAAAKALLQGISSTVKIRVPPVGYLSTVNEGIPIDGLYGALLFTYVINEEKGQEVKFYCVGCVFNSTFQLGGKVSVSLLHGFAGVKATVSGPMQLNFNVAVVASQGGEIKEQKTIISVPLVGVTLGEIGKIGLYIDFAVGFEVSLKAQITYLQNMTFLWDNFHGELNLLVPALSKVSGIIPNHFIPAFQLQGSYTAAAEAFVIASVVIGVSVFDDKYALKVSLNEKPALELSISEQYGAVLNGDGFAPLDCEGYDIAVKLKNDVYLAADVVKNLQLNLNHVEKALWETCLGASKSEDGNESSTSSSPNTGVQTVAPATTTPANVVTSTTIPATTSTPINTNSAAPAGPTCDPSKFQNYGNVLWHNDGDMEDDFESTCFPNCPDDFQKMKYTQYTGVSSMVDCCNNCHANPGGCLFYYIIQDYNDGGATCTVYNQVGISDAGAPFPQPWPSMCPYGGIEVKGYGPGQGSFAQGGYSGELGECAWSTYTGFP